MKAPGMISRFALSLQVVSVLVGISTLGLMLWEPQLEGRNAHAAQWEIYLQDPFLAYVYVGSIPFFVALLCAFRLLGDVRRTGSFPPGALDDLRTIKRCGIVLLGFVGGGVAFILTFGDPDDRPPGLFMGALAALVAGGIAITAARLARKLQRA